MFDDDRWFVRICSFKLYQFFFRNFLSLKMWINKYCVSVYVFYPFIFLCVCAEFMINININRQSKKNYWKKVESFIYFFCHSTLLLINMKKNIFLIFESDIYTEKNDLWCKNVKFIHYRDVWWTEKKIRLIFFLCCWWWSPSMRSFYINHHPNGNSSAYLLSMWCVCLCLIFQLFINELICCQLKFSVVEIAKI